MRDCEKISLDLSRYKTRNLVLSYPPTDRNVNPSRRYRPMEIKESIYTVVMTLIIRDARPDDIRNYTCVARNSKGSAKGTVALQRECSFVLNLLLSIRF